MHVDLYDEFCRHRKQPKETRNGTSDRGREQFSRYHCHHHTTTDSRGLSIAYVHIMGMKRNGVGL